MKNNKLINRLFHNLIPVCISIALFTLMICLFGFLSDGNVQSLAVWYLFISDMLLYVSLIMISHQDKEISLTFVLLMMLVLFGIGWFFGVYVGRTPDLSPERLRNRGMIIGLLIVNFYLIINNLILSYRMRKA